MRNKRFCFSTQETKFQHGIPSPRLHCRASRGTHADVFWPLPLPSWSGALGHLPLVSPQASPVLVVLVKWQIDTNRNDKWMDLVTRVWLLFPDLVFKYSFLYPHYLNKNKPVVQIGWDVVSCGRPPPWQHSDHSPLLARSGSAPLGLSLVKSGNKSGRELSPLLKDFPTNSIFISHG